MRSRGVAGLVAGGLLFLLAVGVSAAPPDSFPSSATPPAAATVAEKSIVLFFYCLAIMAASLAGGYLPALMQLTHNRMQTMISFVGGLMLGIGVFHMLPHSVREIGAIDVSVRWLMAGLLVMFFLLRTFHFHQHDVVVADKQPLPAQLIDEDESHAEPPHDHDHDCAGHRHAPGDGQRHAHQLSWVGITVGLCLHTLIDGVALGAAVEADSTRQTLFSLFGVGTFLAILLHKPLDALSITGLMSAGGWSKSARNLVNLGFSLMCPIGAAAFLFGIRQFDIDHSAAVGAALAASAGVFICIALSDLLPEMEFHSHNRMRLTLALLLGIALAWAIGFLEPEHAHNHGESAAISQETAR
jgi:zinc and cadmium transporter